MAFNKDTAKEAGKKSSRKGTQNKSTNEIRELFQTLLENNIEKIQVDLDLMKPEQRVKTILDLSKFVIPTLRATEHSGGIDSKEKVVTISFKD